ncbi:MAG: hypothetical protein ACI9QC_000349 [Oceanicoccus sp.]|jgi:hypothetical protein
MKKKDKKNLLIALVVLAAVIFTGLGIWNYSADSNFLRFNHRSNLPTVAPIESAPPEMVPVELPEAIDTSTSLQEVGMNGIK